MEISSVIQPDFNNNIGCVQRHNTFKCFSNARSRLIRRRKRICQRLLNTARTQYVDVLTRIHCRPIIPDEIQRVGVLSNSERFFISSRPNSSQNFIMSCSLRLISWRIMQRLAKFQKFLADFVAESVLLASPCYVGRRSFTALLEMEESAQFNCQRRFDKPHATSLPRTDVIDAPRVGKHRDARWLERYGQRATGIKQTIAAAAALIINRFGEIYQFGENNRQIVATEEITFTTTQRQEGEVVRIASGRVALNSRVEELQELFFWKIKRPAAGVTEENSYYG